MNTEAASTSTGSAPSVQRLPIPRQAYVCIEYPGLLKPATSTSQAAQASLDAALRTLSPQPALYATSTGALSHISRCLALESSVIECRLTAGRGSDEPVLSSSSSLHAEASTSDSKQAYRHAVLGEFVDTQNFVARIQTRKWKRVKRSAMHLDEPPQQQASPSESGSSSSSNTTTNNNVQYAYEHTARVLGVARKTARWRSLADFTGAPEPQPLPDPQQTSSASLVDAMLRMDYGKLCEYTLQPETENYEVESGETKEMRSNLGLLPPPMFSHVQVPHAFRQNPASLLQQIDESNRQRFVNKQRHKNTAPISWGMKVAVPTEPKEDVQKEKESCDSDMLKKVEACFEKQPVWRREALYNQFTSNERRQIKSNKLYVPLVAYNVSEGPWKDCLVRYGYDVRESDESRFFQRIVVQGKGQHNFARVKPKHRGVFKQYGGALSVNNAAAGAAAGAASESRDSRSPVRSRSPGTYRSPGAGTEESPERTAAAADGAGSDAEQEGDDGDAAEEHEGTEGSDGKGRSHIFDGVTLTRGVGNYMLCDIKDPVIIPYIEAEGPDNIRETVDSESGWYTALALERIKALLGHRFRSLLEREEAASEESCRAIIKGINERAANAALKAAGGASSKSHEPEPEPEHESGSDSASNEEEHETHPAALAPASKGRGRGRPRGSRGTGSTRGAAKGRGAGPAKARGTGRPRGRPRGSGKGKRGGGASAGPSTGADD